jgi:hypothetical protein
MENVMECHSDFLPIFQLLLSSFYLGHWSGHQGSENAGSRRSVIEGDIFAVYLIQLHVQFDQLVQSRTFRVVFLISFITNYVRGGRSLFALETHSVSWTICCTLIITCGLEQQWSSGAGLHIQFQQCVSSKLLQILEHGISVYKLTYSFDFWCLFSSIYRTATELLMSSMARWTMMVGQSSEKSDPDRWLDTCCRDGEVHLNV